ncbi:MAG: substrate-binding domain-containing protein [Propionibacteriaceae bacterium]|jgi:phosphate transport system substrate-binding protein|nr:substrate-binding domain-containing protein [Propionibacteriaceae bacterium]
MIRRNALPIGTVLKITISIAALVIGLIILEHFEYLSQFHVTDNIVGMIPVVLIATAVAMIIALTWIRHRSNRASTIILAIILVASVALFPNALRGNWWINPTASTTGEAAPDLTLYAPFLEGSLTVKLDEKSDLTLTGNLPKLDGATASYPLYSAFAEAAYDRQTFTEDDVVCTNTRGSFEALMTGEADVIFVAQASQKQREAARQAGIELVFTPIGREAFVFLVGKDNPITEVSQDQLRAIYSGKTSQWRTLGWNEGGQIIAFQRPEGSGSQTGLAAFIGRQIPIQVPQPLPDPSLLGENSLVQQVSVEWQGVQPALGYSYRYFATTMYSNPDTKLLGVDGVMPTTETIHNGTYPFVGDFYAVTVGEPTGTTKELVDWILSPQGQRLIEDTGYVPINPT